ncbi:glycerophosphodiester phosphodiesterase family protein [Verrucomicrobiaceae bacterium N1E253]|uniref:Glycerophosphodiester phosphodiesterase family protein n=1 Tax=Oceaniferula marina TaxID=2748318 RepID=A0A851GIY2_9BACT|nr:glycerophosphodiester phosphodiesterase family protein [Oceaniferula marina]NWK55077.1 glycerophosphodiester phosphodiesterase family protein [Oceaniferula marina]
MKLKFTTLTIAALSIAITHAAEQSSEQIRRMAEDPANKNVLVVAHRAAWKKAPENSIQSILDAIAMRVDMIEVDVRKTKDGRFVLMHDSTINRTTTGKGKVSQYTLAELREFRLKHQGKASDQRIPTLEEALAVCKGKILVNLDKIHSHLAEINPILEKTGTASQVVLKGGHSMEKVDQMLGKDRKVIYMPIFNVDKKGKAIAAGEKLGFDDVYPINERVRMVEVIVRDIHSPALSKAFMDEFKKRKVRVWINTLRVCHPSGHADANALRDPEKVWGSMIDMGVSIFQTDEPEFLLQYLRKKGLHQ